MKWPWQKYDLSDRGSLTFLPDGGVIIGFPAKYGVTQEQVYEMRLKWADHKEHNGPLVLPFAVDVVDLRGKS